RGLMMSGRLRSALSSVPTTNPICTERVSQLAADSVSCHSFVNAGMTAEPLNHSDMPSNSAIASSTSVRQRDLNLSVEESRAFCKREIVAQTGKRLDANLSH